MRDYNKLLLGIPFLAVGLDQGLKLWVHANMSYGSAGELSLLGAWLKLHYITNPGMAFGILPGGTWGKLVLSLLRWVVMGGVGVYYYHCYRKGDKAGILVGLGMIVGGAMGNVIDGTFYGIWLQNASSDAPFALFHGQVIDMIYVDIWEGFVHESVPLIGGQYLFLWPIFNLADAFICIGVVWMLIGLRIWK